jgi:3-isopropylmalate dehydrogenase
VFEAVHGSAPDIAGRNLANPLALLMSAVMMLNHLAETREDPACAATGRRIKDAYNRALALGEKTRDLGGTLGTAEFAAAVVAHLAG